MSSGNKKPTTQSHKKNTTEHQQESEPEPEPSCPCTRAKNATQCPGVKAKKRLQVRRDPADIQKEKDVKKKKKEKRECAK